MSSAAPRAARGEKVSLVDREDHFFPPLGGLLREEVGPSGGRAPRREPGTPPSALTIAACIPRTPIVGLAR